MVISVNLVRKRASQAPEIRCKLDFDTNGLIELRDADVYVARGNCKEKKVLKFEYLQRF